MNSEAITQPGNRKVNFRGFIAIDYHHAGRTNEGTT